MDHRLTLASKLNKRKQPQIYFIKLLLILIWGLFLLLATLTDSVERLLTFQSFEFSWVPHPNLMSFFYFMDFTWYHNHVYLVKLGHFLGFAILDFLIFNLLKKHRWSIMISAIFAFLTEFLQLFFDRDGRFYDFIIDTFGILTIYFWYRFRKKSFKPSL
ncbi:VanZ family protein [Neobacillus sp. Marseille-QA0830]